MQTKNLIEQLLSIHPERNIQKKSFKIRAEYLDLIDAIKLMGEIILTERGEVHDYIVDERNSKIINYIAKWLTNDSNLSISEINKGLLVRGDKGTGKTLLFDIISRILAETSDLRLHIVSAYDIEHWYRISSFDQIHRILGYSAICIDDVGCDMPEILTFGNRVNPMVDFIERRYDKHKITCITTNLRPSELTERYGDRVLDRLKAMCNDIVLEGDSLRR